jgi:hypothetical protein
MQEDMFSGGAAGVGVSPCALGPGWLTEYSTCSATLAVSGVAAVGAIKGWETGRMGLAGTVTEGGRVCGTGRTGPADAVMEGGMVGATDGGASDLCIDGSALGTCIVGEGAIWTGVGAARPVVGAVPIRMKGLGTQGGTTDGCLDSLATSAVLERRIRLRVAIVRVVGGAGVVEGPAGVTPAEARATERCGVSPAPSRMKTTM